MLSFALRNSGSANTFAIRPPLDGRPAPVSHGACFANAGFDLFGDNDEDWDGAAERLLRRVVENLSGFGAASLVSKAVRDDLRLSRTGRKLPLPEQALLPMQWDALPLFHARFGDSGAALRSGDGRFLLWVDLPDAGPGWGWRSDME